MIFIKSDLTILVFSLNFFNSFTFNTIINIVGFYIYYIYISDILFCVYYLCHTFLTPVSAFLPSFTVVGFF